MGNAYRRDVGLVGATAVVAGSMVGSGIFLVSAEMVRQVRSGPLLLLTWALTGLLTLCATLSYAELAAAFPRAGGMYTYLREAYGERMGFLYGWGSFAVIESGAIAAVAVGFGSYLALFVPALQHGPWLLGPWKVPALHLAGLDLGPYELGLSPVRAAALGLVLLVSLVNGYGVKVGSRIQSAFTFAKLGGLGALILLGLFAPLKAAPSPAPFTGTGAALPLLAAVLVAQVGSFFSCEGWSFVGNITAEVREPERTLPRSLVLGPVLVVGLYLLANLAYLRVLGPTGIAAAPEDRVGAAVLGALLGPAGARAMALAILVSMVGYVNGAVFTTARVYQAMGEDGLFLPGSGRLNRHGVPGPALAWQALWTGLLTFTGSFDQLVELSTTVQLLFVILMIAGVLVLRRRRAGTPRPFRVRPYPLLPLAYVLGAGSVLLVLLRLKPSYSWPGLLLVALGWPVHAWLSRGRPAPPASGPGEP